MRSHWVGTPSLPTEYTRLLDGQPIGPKNGSCGTAAYLGQRVCSVSPITNELGEVAGALGFVRDATER